MTRQGDNEIGEPGAPETGGRSETDRAVGRALNRLRQAQSLTIRELGEAAGISPAMISRIENGLVSPSLGTLDALARALSVPVIGLFEETVQSADINFVQAGGGLAAKRVTPGHVHDYRILGQHMGPHGTFEAACVTLHRETAVNLPTYQGPGYAFMFIVAGEGIYRCGDQEFAMSVGDSISFDARLRHGVARVTSERFEYVTVSSKHT